MSDAVAVIVLVAEALFAAASGWLVVCALAAAEGDLWESTLSWLWSFGAVVVACALAAGSLGILGPAALAVGFVALFLVLLFLRRGRLQSDLRLLLGLLGRLRAAALEERGCVLGLCAVLVFLAGVAAAAQPGIFDALSYRLPRIAQWLQDGRVGYLPANDPRINYMPVVPDLFMAWLMSGFSQGFQPSILAQSYGGLLLCVGTFGLSRLQGLSRRASLLSVMLLFGMASVVLQFTAADTDLFAAGQLVAAFALWWRAARRGEGSILAGLAGGLALSSKGTLFYLGPGALLWVAWVGWSERLRPRSWAKTMVAIILSFAVFGLPVFVRNERIFGGPFGPAGFVRMHHGSAPAGQQLRKLGLNVRSSLAQLFEPHSQPPGFESLSRECGLAIARDLPSEDPFSYDGLNRHATLVDILERPEPDADKESLGVLCLCGLAAAVLSAAGRRRPGSGHILAWSAGIVVYWLFFLGLQLWHPYGFRYYTLVAPWICVCTAWWIEGLPEGLARMAWRVVLLLCAGIAWKATFETPQSGWMAATQPLRAGSYAVYDGWRQWAQSLDLGQTPLRPCLPYNSPAAAFYRLPGGRRVEPQLLPASGESAQAVLAGRAGWLIAPASLFEGNEGQVVANSFLPTGDAAGPFSLAAYRLMRPGERPPAILYRNRRTVSAHGCAFQLIVRSWEGRDARIRILNSESFPCRISLADAGQRLEQDLGPGQSATFTLQVAAGALSEVRVEMKAGDPGSGPVRNVDLRWIAP